MTSRPVRRTAALLTCALLSVGAAACADDSANKDASRSAESGSPEETKESPAGAAADLPLAEDVTADGERPAWALPVVDGWSVPAEGAPGVFQISKDGSEALVTAYQQGGADSGSDEEGGKAWLENYHDQISALPEATDVTDPTYGTTVLDSTQGRMEFVSQELRYSTPDGTRYRSLYVARSIGDDVFALQYAAPEDEWSDEEWAEINESGLKLTL